MKNFIKEVFEKTIESTYIDETILSHYFSPDYIQHVDGHILNYQDFVQHMNKQKTLIKSAKFFIEECLTEENKIFTKHIVEAINLNGNKIIVKVIAFFELKDQKLVFCDELTRLLQGEKQDANIGSIK